MTIHPLDDVRGLQEEAKEKARWTLIVREQISVTLLSTGYFHSDDLDPLGIPEQHRNIAGSQIGSYVSRSYMQEVGRRKSIRPSRKSAKSAIYKITEKGRQELSKLVGVENQRGRDRQVRGAGSAESEGPAKAAAGAAGPTKLGRPSEGLARRNTQPARLSDSSETLSLLPEPDPEAWAA